MKQVLSSHDSNCVIEMQNFDNKSHPTTQDMLSNIIIIMSDTLEVQMDISEGDDSNEEEDPNVESNS